MRLASKSLAKKILSRPDIKHAYPDVKKAVNQPCVIFPYFPGIGLFPSSLLPTCTTIHAAIFEEARGKSAVLAAREAISYLNGYGRVVVTKVRPEDKRAQYFAVLCGGERYHKTDHYIYYRF